MNLARTQTITRTWWAFAITALIVGSVALALALPTNAFAGAPQKTTGGGAAQKTTTGGGAPTKVANVATTSYRGWAYSSASYSHQIRAYRWTGTAWQQVSFGAGWAYVQPYSGQWRAAWTQSTGWVVLGGGLFEVR